MLVHPWSMSDLLDWPVRPCPSWICKILPLFCQISYSFSFIFYSLFIGLWWLQSRVIAKKSWPRENIFPGTNPFLLNIMIIVSGQSLFKWSIMLSLKAICRLVKYDERQQEGFSLLSSNNDGLRAVPSGLVPNSVTSVFTLYAHY